MLKTSKHSGCNNINYNLFLEKRISATLSVNTGSITGAQSRRNNYLKINAAEREESSILVGFVVF